MMTGVVALLLLFLGLGCEESSAGPEATPSQAVPETAESLQGVREPEPANQSPQTFTRSWPQFRLSHHTLRRGASSDEVSPATYGPAEETDVVPMAVMGHGDDAFRVGDTDWRCEYSAPAYFPSPSAFEFPYPSGAERSRRVRGEVAVIRLACVRSGSVVVLRHLCPLWIEDMDAPSRSEPISLSDQPGELWNITIECPNVPRDRAEGWARPEE